VFYEDQQHPDDLCDVITEYINFCVDRVIPTKEVKIFPNNKPWISKDMKRLLNNKKRAFMQDDREKVKHIQKEINQKTRQCKADYKEKVERQFQQSDLRQAWQGVNTMIGKTKRQQTITVAGDKSFAEELNSFYCRFDCHDFTKEREAAVEAVPIVDTDISITVDDVIQSFTKINIRKARGPDKLDGIVLKECRVQLCHVFTRLFQLSLDTHVIPSVWKHSEIIPVPKKSTPKELNDYRPVALTSIAMKSLERIVLKYLRKDVFDILDPLQFAYRPNRGVVDATLSLLNNIYKHLETPKAYVRILFVDFSSAFNTIQPHILIQKLLDMGVNSTLIRSSSIIHGNRLRWLSD